MKPRHVTCQGGPYKKLRFDQTERYPAVLDPELRMVDMRTGELMGFYRLCEGLVKKKRKDPATGKSTMVEEKAPVYVWQPAITVSDAVGGTG